MTSNTCICRLLRLSTNYNICMYAKIIERQWRRRVTYVLEAIREWAVRISYQLFTTGITLEHQRGCICKYSYPVNPWWFQGNSGNPTNASFVSSSLILDIRDTSSAVIKNAPNCKDVDSWSSVKDICPYGVNIFSPSQLWYGHSVS